MLITAVSLLFMRGTTTLPSKANKEWDSFAFWPVLISVAVDEVPEPYLCRNPSKDLARQVDFAVDVALDGPLKGLSIEKASS